MNFHELMQAQIQIMEGLFNTASDANRDLTEEEQTRYNAAETEFKRLKALKEKADALQALKKDVPTAPAPAHVQGDDDEPAAPATVANASTINAGGRRSAEKPFGSFGNFMVDVYGASQNNPEATERLVKNELSTQTGGQGAFFIPPEYLNGLLEDAKHESQLLSQSREMAMKGNTGTIPGVDETSRADGSRYGGIQFYWVTEGGSGTYSEPKFRAVDIKLGKLIGLLAVTEEMLEDSPLLASWTNSAFAAELAFSIDQALYDGDGNGKPLGVIKSNALVTVARETADTVTYIDVVKLYNRLPFRNQQRARWYVTQEAMDKLPLMNLAVGDAGSAVWLPAGGASASPYQTLFGRPVIPLEHSVALGTEGDVLFADMNDYLVFNKSGMRQESSIAVYFASDKRAFRFVKRINGTPYTKVKKASRSKSTFYTSPYAALTDAA